MDFPSSLDLRLTEGRISILDPDSRSRLPPANITPTLLNVKSIFHPLLPFFQIFDFPIFVSTVDSQFVSTNLHIYLEKSEGHVVTLLLFLNVHDIWVYLFLLPSTHYCDRLPTIPLPHHKCLDSCDSSFTHGHGLVPCPVTYRGTRYRGTRCLPSPPGPPTFST